MILTDRQLTLATRCLWLMQENHYCIDGLLLVKTSGLIITTTLKSSASTQRLAAVSATLFRLADEASESWGSGIADEIHLIFSEDDENVSSVQLYPVGEKVVLLAILRENDDTSWRTLIDKGVNYLTHLIANDTTDEFEI